MLRKRISIRIEHTEVTLTVTEVFSREAGAASSHAPPPRCCPVCGSPWLPNLRDILGGLHVPAAQLKLAASKGKLHLFCSPDNDVWVCERSIQEMKDDSHTPRFSKRHL